MWFQFVKMRVQLIKFVCVLIYLPTIQSDCLIKFKKDGDIVPRFEKSIGKFRIKVPINETKEMSYIRLYNKESVIGRCETYFSPIVYTQKISNYDYRRRTSYIELDEENISKQTTITLNCNNGALYLDNKPLTSQMLSCEERNWSIYTTKVPYGWCKENQNSNTFLFATRNLKNVSNILAAFCYNMEQLSLQTFVYNKTIIQNYSSHRPTNLDGNETASYDILDENLWNFKTTIVTQLSNDVLRKTLNEMAKTYDWLYLADYEVSLIVQEEVLAKYFKDYEGIFNIIWWRPLRMGNWKHFQKTLTEYALNNSYELYAGTSGVAQYPVDGKCYKQKNLELKLDFRNETVPAYIWTYLKSTDQSNKDFVIVGYNSPFAEYFTMENIIFCPDICKEIPWLQEISATFRFAYAGIMFCCSTDFIRQTQYLQGFPMDALPPAPVYTTTEVIEADYNYFHKVSTEVDAATTNSF